MCARVHARMLLVVVVTHHTCSNTSPGSSSLPSGANLAQMETLHWKTVTFLPMKPISEEAGVAALCLAGRATHLRPQDRMEQDRMGASPEADTGIAVGSSQPWSSSARKHLFSSPNPSLTLQGTSSCHLCPLASPREQGTARLSSVGSQQAGSSPSPMRP